MYINNKNNNNMEQYCVYLYIHIYAVYYSKRLRVLLVFLSWALHGMILAKPSSLSGSFALLWTCCCGCAGGCGVAGFSSVSAATGSSSVAGWSFSLFWPSDGISTKVTLAASAGGGFPLIDGLSRQRFCVNEKAQRIMHFYFQISVVYKLTIKVKYI